MFKIRQELLNQPKNARAGRTIFPAITRAHVGAFPPSGVTRAVKWILSCRKRIPLGVTHFHFVILQLNFLYRDLYLRNTFSTFHLCLSCSQYIFLALSFYLSLSMSIMYMYIYISTLGSPYI